MGGAEGVEQKLQNQALRNCCRAEGGNDSGVESVDTIIDTAQTRFFTRVVADPTAIGICGLPSEARGGVGRRGEQGLQGSRGLFGPK